MRIVFLVVTFFSLLVVEAQSLEFGRGPVMCRVFDSEVKTATIPSCSLNPGKIQMSASCNAVLTTATEVRAYGISINLDLKTTKVPQRASPVQSFLHLYDGVLCWVTDDRIIDVMDCREYADGAIRQCTVCLKDDHGGTCYYAHLVFDKQTLGSKADVEKELPPD